VRDVNKENELGPSVFTGLIDEIVARLNKLKDRGIVYIDAESYGYDGGVEFYACRLETDLEESRREEHEAVTKKIREEERLEKARKKEERQRIDFERLKQKFEPQ